MDYDDLTPAIEEELTSLINDKLKPKFIIPKLLVATYVRTLPTALGLTVIYIYIICFVKIQVYFVVIFFVIFVVHH